MSIPHPHSSERDLKRTGRGSIGRHMCQTLYGHSVTNLYGHVIPISQTRKRKLNFREIEQFVGYVNIGAQIQIYRLLTAKSYVLPLYQTASQKRKKESEFTKATLLKSKNREVQLLSSHSLPHFFFKETKQSC